MTTREQLWADVYAHHVAKGAIWFRAEEEANTAVKSFDRNALATPPAPTTEPTAKPITGLTEEECIAILKMGQSSVWMARAVERAFAEKNGLAVQGGEHG